jgi:hypothetical protein
MNTSTTLNAKPYTVHDVLAGAYRGHRVALDKLLTHASTDEGVTALCGKIKKYNLCDEILDKPVTCPACARKIRGLEP